MNESDSFQQRLATWVITIGSIITGLCSIVAIVATGWGSSGANTAQAAKDILSILLPLIGTWVGTVLAFYFSRANFESASRETRLTLGQRLSKPAMEKAILINEVKSINVADDAAARALSLQSIDKSLKDSGFLRIPILTMSKQPLYIVHRQPLDSYIAAQARAEKPLALLTLGALLDSPEGQVVKNSFATVGERATLAEAKIAMEARNGCQDVFITQTGKDDAAVLGWLTNNEIQREATVQQ